jgi:hypothetical protein
MDILRLGLNLDRSPRECISGFRRKPFFRCTVPVAVLRETIGLLQFISSVPEAYRPRKHALIALRGGLLDRDEFARRSTAFRLVQEQWRR